MFAKIREYCTGSAVDGGMFAAVGSMEGLGKGV